MNTEQTTETASTAAPKAPKAAKEFTAPVTGDKFAGQYDDPNEYVIVGLDTEVPDGSSPILARLYQPERLAQIKQDGVDDLASTIKASGAVNTPVTYVIVKCATKKDPTVKARKCVAQGRRRVLASRKLWAKGDHFPVPGIKGEAYDPNLWLAIRSENQGRAEESPLAIAREVRIMREGDPQLGVPKMDFKTIAALYGLSLIHI